MVEKACWAVLIVAAVGPVVPGVSIADAYAIEEIVVTAQKREESLSTVPVSVQVISGDALVEMGISDVKELYMIAPSVVTIGGSSLAASGLKIRGIGNPGFGEGIEGSVGVMLDGVTTGTGGSSMSTLFDVERVEVLRGPQGTIFGKNATAGVVAVVSKSPTREFEANGHIRYAEAFDDTHADFAINGPVSDAFSVRAAGFYRDRAEGETDTPAIGGTEGSLDRKGIRLSGLWEDGPLSALASLMYVDQRDNCCARIMVALNDNPATHAALLRNVQLPALQLYGATPGSDNDISVNNRHNVENVDTYHTVLDMSYQLLSGQVIRSITGYRDWDSNAFNDSDTTPYNILDTNAYRQTVVKSEELQLLSPADGKANYILGLYIDNTEFTRDVTYSGGTDFPTIGAGTYGSTIVDATYTIGNYAIFGNTQYQFTDKWSAFLGARFLVETNKIKALRTGNQRFFPGDFGPPKKGSTNDSDWTAKLGVEYQLSDSTMLFATGARGYKGEAVNFSVSGPIYVGDPNDAWVDPETVWSGEIGVKTYLFDRRLNLNATAFYQRYDDYQADSVDASTIVRTLMNAGKLESKGVEVDLMARPWTGMSFSGNVSLTKAQFLDFEGGPCTVDQSLGVPGCVQDLSGKPLNGVPEWAFNVIAEQEFNVISRVPAYVRAEYSWRDEITYDLDLDPYTKQGAYGLANFRIGLQPTSNVELVAFIENAFDKHYSYFITDYTLMNGAYAGYVGYGRSFGVELKVSL
jgi:iron complex outermembrane receptor protein